MSNPAIKAQLAPLLLAVGLFCLAAAPAQAQTVTSGPDSVQVKAGPSVADSLRRTERLFGLRMTRPQKSVILAAVLPGAGQVYNHKYWKLPLVYAALGGTVAGEVFYWKRYKDFAAGYRARQLRASGVDPAVDPRAVDTYTRSKDYPQNATGDAQQQNALNFYRTHRDTFFAYIALAYGAQILDALVDGHLYNFDVSDNLSLNAQPYVLPLYGAPSAGMAFTFTLH